MTEPDESFRRQLINAVRKRINLENRQATGLLVLVILLWYLFQLSAVIVLKWDMERLRWVFTTASYPRLSPGLFLATISHSYPPRITHVLSNSFLLWLFAGESEQHMGKTELIVFFAITGVISVITSTALSVESTMGASGAALAFVGFYSLHMVLEHRTEFNWQTSTGSDSSEISPSALWVGLVVLVPVVLIPSLIVKLAGIVPSGRVDVVGHFIGTLLGIGYAVLRYSKGN